MKTIIFLAFFLVDVFSVADAQERSNAELRKAKSLDNVTLDLVALSKNPNVLTKVQEYKNFRNRQSIGKKSENLINYQSDNNLNELKKTIASIYLSLEKLEPFLLINPQKQKDIPARQSNISRDFCRDDKECTARLSSYSKSLAQRDQTVQSCENLQEALLNSEYRDQLNHGGIKFPTPIEEKQLSLSDLNVLREYKSNLRQYYKTCTTDVPLKMARVMGIVVDKSRPFDVGVYINGEHYMPIGMAVQISKDKIYTAKHLLFPNEEQTMRDIKKLVFIPMANPTKVIPLTLPIAGIEEQTGEDIADDQVVLTLSKPYSPNGPFARVSKTYFPQESPQLIIAGFQLPLAQIASDERGKTKSLNLDTWKNYIRLDAAKSCRLVTQNSAGCMLYSCNTIGGVSGAPIFVNDESENDTKPPTVIGIHHGSGLSNQDSKCNAGEYARHLNAGAVPKDIPPDLLLVQY